MVLWSALADVMGLLIYLSFAVGSLCGAKVNAQGGAPES